MLIQFTKTRRNEMGQKPEPYTGGLSAGTRALIQRAGGLKALVEDGGVSQKRLVHRLQKLVGEKSVFVAEELSIALEELAEQGVTTLTGKQANELVTNVRKHAFALKMEQKAVRRIRTPEGARMYGQPIGTIITRDMIEAVGDPDEVDKPDADTDKPSGTRSRPAADLKPGDQVSFSKPGDDGKPQQVSGTVEAVETDGNTTTVTVDGETHKLGAKNPVESTREGNEPEPDSRSRVLDDLRNGAIDQDEARRRIALVDAGTPEMIGDDADADAESDSPPSDTGGDLSALTPSELLNLYNQTSWDSPEKEKLKAELDRRRAENPRTAALRAREAEAEAARQARADEDEDEGTRLSSTEDYDAVYDKMTVEQLDSMVKRYEKLAKNDPVLADVLERIKAAAARKRAESEAPDADENELEAWVLDHSGDLGMAEADRLTEMLSAGDMDGARAVVEEWYGTDSEELAEFDALISTGGAPDLLAADPDEAAASREDALSAQVAGRNVTDKPAIGDEIEVDGQVARMVSDAPNGGIVVEFEDGTRETLGPEDDYDLILPPEGAAEDNGESPNLVASGVRDEEIQKAKDDDEYDTSVELDEDGEYLTVLPPVSRIADHMKQRYPTAADVPQGEEGWLDILEDLDYPVDGDDFQAMDVLLDRIEKAQALAYGVSGDDDASQIDPRMEARGDGKKPLPEGKYAAGDPRNDPEYEAYTEELDTKIKAALAAGQDTESQFAVKVGNDVVWTPTRARMHDEIIDQIMGQAAANNVPQDRKAIMMGGLPGAGKSTFLRQHGHRLGLDVNSKGDPTNAIIINPDEMKSLLMDREGAVPRVDGLSDGEHASLVHEESSHLAKMLAARALAGGYNVVFDITLGDGKKAKSKYLSNPAGTGARDLGYSVYAAFVDGDMPTSLHRAGLRHKRPDPDTGERPMTGRYVSYGHIMSEAPKPGQTDADGNPAKSKNRVEYDGLVAEGDTFDYAIRMDNVTGEFYVDKEGEDLPFMVPDDIRAAAFDNETE